MPAPRELNPTDSLATFLGHKVRREREKRGWRQEDLAGKVFVSRVRVAKIELGTDPPNPTLASRFDQVLGLVDELHDLATLINHASFRNYAQTYLMRQTEATVMHDFSIVVPGLLQTEEYARAIMLTGRGGDPTDTEQYVEYRMARQAVWERANPPWLWLVLDVAVLRRTMGSHRIMRDQLSRIREMTELPHINVQILPDDASSIHGNLSLLTMPDGSRAAYTEGYETGAYTEEPSQVAHFQRIYDRLHADALSAASTAGQIERFLKEHS